MIWLQSGLCHVFHDKLLTQKKMSHRPQKFDQRYLRMGAPTAGRVKIFLSIFYKLNVFSHTQKDGLTGRVSVDDEILRFRTQFLQATGAFGVCHFQSVNFPHFGSSSYARQVLSGINAAQSHDALTQRLDDLAQDKQMVQLSYFETSTKQQPKFL
jgi:hypothetical protein